MFSTLSTWETGLINRTMHIINQEFVLSVSNLECVLKTFNFLVVRIYFILIAMVLPVVTINKSFVGGEYI